MDRILLLSRTFPPPDGGAQRRYANLCRSFPEGSVEVCTSRRAGAEAFDRRERAAREIYAVFTERSRLPLPPWRPRPSPAPADPNHRGASDRAPAPARTETAFRA